ncbi:unnamed protein product [Arctogadus glacialis]
MASGGGLEGEQLLPRASSRRRSDLELAEGRAAACISARVSPRCSYGNGEGLLHQEAICGVEVWHAGGPLTVGPLGADLIQRPVGPRGRSDPTGPWVRLAPGSDRPLGSPGLWVRLAPGSDWPLGQTGPWVPPVSGSGEAL